MAKKSEKSEPKVTIKPPQYTVTIDGGNGGTVGIVDLDELADLASAGLSQGRSVRLEVRRK